MKEDIYTSNLNDQDAAAIRENTILWRLSEALGLLSKGDGFATLDRDYVLNLAIDRIKEAGENRTRLELESQVERLWDMYHWAVMNGHPNSAYGYQHQRFALQWVLDVDAEEPLGFAKDFPEAGR